MSLAAYLRHAIPSWRVIFWAWRSAGRIAVLSTVWSHHAKRSGYHPVAKGLGVAFPTSMRLIPAAISRRIVGKGLDRAQQIALGMKLTGRDQLLVVDGDFQLKLIEDIRKVTTARIYAVFHQNPKVLKELLAQAPRGLLDVALCVARCQIPLVQSLAPPGQTWFVPHGVDADYFAPSAPRSNHASVLCVGYHYRDFATLRKSADIIVRAVPTASIRLVAPRALLDPRLDLGRIELLTSISDEQLLEEYRRAWVVLLPLAAATANNSLLESMACGTPVVVTDIGGVRDYVGSECGALCAPGDAQSHGKAVVDLLRDPLRRELAGRAARARAESYAWPVVREQIRLIINNKD